MTDGASAAKPVQETLCERPSTATDIIGVNGIVSAHFLNLCPQ
jgi:hypothetical protein